MDYKEQIAYLRYLGQKRKDIEATAKAEREYDAALQFRQAIGQQIAKLTSRAEAAEARAEKAESERDAAVKELNGVASTVDDLSDFIDEQIYPLVQYDMYLALRENADAISMWQYESDWNGKKED